MILGSLELTDAFEAEGLLANPVRDALQVLPRGGIFVASIDGSFSDTAAFCERYGIGPEQAANCVILKGKNGDTTFYAACIILATTRADINGLAKKTLEAKKLSFAPMEEAVKETGMEFGAITPIGLPEAWPILIDAAVTKADAVVIGSGKRSSKIILQGSILLSLPGTIVLDGLGQTR